MKPRHRRDIQDAPGTEEQTGNPDPDVGEDAVPDQEPGPGGCQ